MPVLESPTTPSVAEKPRESLGWRILVTGLRLFLVLALAATAGGAWYLARKGFGREWRALLVAELHKRGIEASVRRVTLDPFQGLVAQDVVLFDYRNRDNVLAQISRLSLEVNYGALIHRQPFLNALDVRNAELTLPLPAGAPPNSPRARVEHLHAHVYFPPEQIFVREADGFIAGIHVSATGQLVKRHDYKPSRELTEEEWQERLRWVDRTITELSKFRFPVAPQLQLKFSGDLEELDQARVEGTLRAEALQRGNYQARQFMLTADYSNETLTISHCAWQDAMGQFGGGARWRRANSELVYQARSSVDLSSLLEACGFGTTLLHDFKLSASPQLELSGKAIIGEGRPQWQTIGHAALGAFSYKGIAFTSAEADLSWDGTRTLLRDVHIRHPSGEMTAELLDAPEDFRLELASTIDANALRSLAPADLREFVREGDWPHAPIVRLTIRGPSRAPAGWRGDGKLQLDRGRFRGVGFNSAAADVHFASGTVTYENFRVVRDEGVATGTIVYDFAHHETRLSNVHSSLRPSEAIIWIEPKLLKVVTPYKFDQPPSVTVNGVYQFHGGKDTRLELTVDSPRRMQYVFLGKTLPFDHVAARLLLTDDRLQITDLNSAIFSGVVRGSADISLAHNDQRYHASLETEGIDFPRLTNLYFDFKNAKGSLNGRYEWDGVGDEARSMSGKGSIDIRNGEVFSIPVFGPLSDLVNNVIPGIGYRVARRATATFTLAKGVIHTNDFRVDGGTFGMVGRGDAQFLENKLDFDVRIDASGLGMVLSPLYKFFEYKGEGSLSHPTWRPKNF
ncbi:MAG: AsmA-like C-terminal region-containing protein [Verrucomicrobiota bacterium]